MVPVFCSPRRCFRVAEIEALLRAGQGRAVVEMGNQGVFTPISSLVGRWVEDR